MGRRSAISLEIGGGIACGEIGIEGVQNGDWQGIDNLQQDFDKRSACSTQRNEKNYSANKMNNRTRI
jgi:hypothetical protein